jgi:hypothetical protein
VVREIPEFKGDVAHLDGMDFAGELGSDYVLAARVNLSKCVRMRGHALRSVPACQPTQPPHLPPPTQPRHRAAPLSTRGSPPLATRNDVIRTLPLFDTFRSALGALASSVGGAVGLETLLGMHCRPGVAEAAQQLLDGTLEAALAAKRAEAEAARAALLANLTDDGAGAYDDDEEPEMS